MKLISLFGYTTALAVAKSTFDISVNELGSKGEHSPQRVVGDVNVDSTSFENPTVLATNVNENILADILKSAKSDSYIQFAAAGHLTSVPAHSIKNGNVDIYFVLNKDAEPISISAKPSSQTEGVRVISAFEPNAIQPFIVGSGSNVKQEKPSSSKPIEKRSSSNETLEDESQDVKKEEEKKEPSFLQKYGIYIAVGWIAMRFLGNKNKTNPEEQQQQQEGQKAVQGSNKEKKNN